MRRVVWWVGANLTILGVLFAAFVLVFRPSWGGLGDTVLMSKESWTVQVMYQPGRTEAMVTLRMDGLSRYKSVNYDVTASVPWAPQWHADMQGKISEFLTLNDGNTQTPYPMSAKDAEDLARSYRVVLSLDGQEKVIDFRDASVGKVYPVFTLRR